MIKYIIIKSVGSGEHTNNGFMMADIYTLKMENYKVGRIKKLTYFNIVD